LHKFINWDGPILTDSGGYQVFSLAKGNNHNKNNNQSSAVIPAKAGIQSWIPDQVGDDNKKSMVKITDDGVEFRSHLDGSSHFFTPEKVIDIQLDLGVDILMPLDVCPSGKATRQEVEEAVRLTTEWAKRSKAHFERKLSITNYQLPINSQLKNDQLTENWKLKTGNCNSRRPLLHGIVQGGLYEDLRRKSASELMALDFDGYSVGGLAVDFETRDMWRIVKLMGEILPEDKQRYLMGVGTPDDIIKATKLGMDMFDCVLPTRLARHGSVYVKSKKYELLNLQSNKFKLDSEVIDKDCGCMACSSTSLTEAGGGYSKAYISHLLKSKEILGVRLTTAHNLWQYLHLMEILRNEI